RSAKCCRMVTGHFGKSAQAAFCEVSSSGSIARRRQTEWNASKNQRTKEPKLVASDAFWFFGSSVLRSFIMVDNPYSSLKVDLSGQTAIVTGASQGLGKAIASALAASGAKVACVARSADELAETVSAINA